MKTKLYLTTIMVFVLTAGQVYAQDSEVAGIAEITEKKISVTIADEAAIVIDGKKYTLPEAIASAIERNPEIYISRFNAAMSDSDRLRFDAKYSPLFIAEGGVSSVTNPELFYTQRGKKNDSLDLSASLVKYFSTGTTFSAGISHTHSKFDTGFGTVYDNINSPVIFASIEQELLKNAFGYNDRKTEKILDNTTRAQRDAYIYSMSMIALGVIADYWNVVIAQNKLDNARVMLAETKKVRGIVSGKVNIGLSEKFEINYWNSLVASSGANLSQAEQQYRNSMRKLLRNVNIDSMPATQENVILTDRLPAINTEEAIKIAFEKRADYLNAVRALENAKLSLQINENSALPSLKGSISVSSMDYNTESYSEAYSNTAGLKYPSYNAKLSLTCPLDDTNQKTEQRNAGWRIEQMKQQLEKTRRDVRDDVTTKAENISTTHKLYTEAKEARRQAEMYYVSMLTNMKRGRFAASSVRDALDGVIKTREMELQILVAYNASLLEFEIAKNQLFESYGIEVNKFIPAK